MTCAFSLVVKQLLDILAPVSDLLRFSNELLLSLEAFLLLILHNYSPFLAMVQRLFLSERCNELDVHLIVLADVLAALHLALVVLVDLLKLFFLEMPLASRVLLSGLNCLKVTGEVCMRHTSSVTGHLGLCWREVGVLEFVVGAACAA